ncbi:LCP family protein [Jonesia quinghaiensis]|uniref:LCP family protein n=1 Tax=Jonesia quinghaiensis TaxID=262806 RepID=UPI00040BEB2A|nr:LCP family protein [Jonesia quinghaiensis]
MTTSNTPTRPAPAHAPQKHPRRILRALSLVTVGVLAFGASATYAGMERVKGLVKTESVVDLVAAPETPPEDSEAGNSINILVMGSDKRADGSVEGMRSDTTMLIHVSEQRDRVEVISIPRDSMVSIPECKVTGGNVLPAQSRAMFNSAFAKGWDYGGDIASAAACTINTVQHNTGLKIDHYVVVDFEGFIGMVDALGGIDIDVPEAVDAPKANKLKLEAGEQTLTGKEALGLVRARTGSGWGLEMGSDLQRIERQQAVLDATAETALSKNLLTDLGKLTQFATAGMSSLTMNPELNDNMIGLATSMSGIDTSKIFFEAVPVIDDPADRNRVVWTGEATIMWQKMAKDDPIVDLPACEDTPNADSDTTTDSTAGDDTSSDAECITTDSDTESTDTVQD